MLNLKISVNLIRKHVTNLFSFPKKRGKVILQKRLNCFFTKRKKNNDIIKNFDFFSPNLFPSLSTKIRFIEKNKLR